MEPIICTQPAAPNLDALPTYKITDYPLEKRDYRPFAQAKVCVTPTQFFLQMWAFEAAPRPLSRLEGVFTTRESQKLLVGWAQADGSCGFLARTLEGDRPLDCLAHTLDGEDLQGVYWGVTLTLSRDLLERELGPGCLEEGGELLGNFYKLSNDPGKPHRGSMVPADFAGGREYALGSLATFRVVRY